MASTSQRTHSSGWQLQNLARPIVQFTSRLHAEWQHRRNERMLESLPSEIRKDIGWPVPDDTTRCMQ